jgi:hypothetical protein
MMPARKIVTKKEIIVTPAQVAEQLAHGLATGHKNQVRRVLQTHPEAALLAFLVARYLGYLRKNALTGYQEMYEFLADEAHRQRILNPDERFFDSRDKLPGVDAGGLITRPRKPK